MRVKTLWVRCRCWFNYENRLQVWCRYGLLYCGCRADADTIEVASPKGKQYDIAIIDFTKVQKKRCNWCGTMIVRHDDVYMSEANSKGNTLN